MVFVVIAMVLLTVGAAGAGANTVVNGDFETGTLEGWQQFNQPEPPSGEWFAYSGTENPFEGPPLIAPPQGTYAASTAQASEGTHILYQDIPIEAGQPYLSMLVYYHSEAPFVTPSPDTLDSEGEANQQYRIELIDPSAPVDTVEPADILATVFRSGAGVSSTSPAQSKGIDLTKFAGQTVRLRLAEVDNQLYLVAGVDSVTTGPVPPPAPPLLPAPTPLSNAFTVGKLKLKKKNGTATLKVTLPGPGSLTATDAKKKSPKRIQKASATAAAAGTVTLKLKPTGAGRKTLMAKGSLKFKATLAFTPSGGSVGTHVLSGKLRMNLTH
jgi:hypothetical protein